ncbi:hypothetical protein ACFQJ7_12520 [Halovenus rubra]|uniref:Uncharacterized protein n=2 Tax=Halovenus rubra TaxID=869890 RepID=A0ACC7E104_9EURY|nr:hypothetical protein [Halovenus rubra]
MRCWVEARQRTRKCADSLRGHAVVEAVDVLPPAKDPTDRWTVEVVLREGTGGVPHQVLDTFGSYQLTLRDVSPQGPYWVAVGTA